MATKYWLDELGTQRRTSSLTSSSIFLSQNGWTRASLNRIFMSAARFLAALFSLYVVVPLSPRVSFSGPQSIS